MIATAIRVLRQIRRDPRTIALLLGVPVGLLTLLRYVFASKLETFKAIGAPMCGLFPFTLMFLITSIAMLRERTSGTLERLMTLPLSKTSLLGGYALAFGLLGAIQASIVSAVGFTLLDLDAEHGVWPVVLLAIGNALLGMALGLFTSAFARTEFQAVQFLPAVVFPQLLLCGLFAPRDAMAKPLQAVAHVFPLTYAFDALSRATRPGPLGSWFVVDVLVVTGCILVALALGAATLRRRTP
jgi:ABC-2 type transport system permease protein